MMNTRMFVVPDYYKKFKCKTGDCRNTCCKGWNVTISREDYFILQGMNCNKKHRQIIDRSVCVLKNPTIERYATIEKNMDNDCPFHMSNGYCMLYAQCGEKVLPNICNYFPRAPRVEYKNECSCSNSCEKVIELLIENDEPISFEEMQLSFKIPMHEAKISQEDKNKYKAIRDVTNKVITNREYPIINRFVILGEILKNIDTVLHDINNIDEYIKKFNPKGNDGFTKTYYIQKKLASYYKEHSASIQKYAQAALDYYGDNDEVNQYSKAYNKLLKLFPNLEIIIEKIMHNYMIYIQFPYSNHLYSLLDEYVSLCGTYLFVNYIVLGYMANKESVEDFVDVVSATFRLISHSSFDSNVPSFMKLEGIKTYEDIYKIL